ncbi:MAG: CRISPR-associated endonuclease Cas2 [Deltaproteobacteria bacterium]|nr:CRISPR-associated endonuclease Cas2 [Deltaproteobacteria bacterium]MBW1927827.1 CRISPR-associated endonuclease Cas2 [Deltaproteobacteria bacterium]MBW2026716.1 CRISPR-associated endonuclease Cas2 [Deltaproteobacteria bacterium]MBW2126568.1 CRISPR-associated endonuclease Cas2 [Deltaproteobacteria bacterium]RLB18034.1 MAG: CRISPR-associated endonuclease Cas2 [Deltaproteobacteria bacterium]
MYILVSYDIVDDKIRNRVSKYLKDFGTRVQKSVFECDLDEQQFAKMKKGLEALINRKEDRVRYYPLCKQCVGRVVISGWGEISEDEGFEVI